MDFLLHMVSTVLSIESIESLHSAPCERKLKLCLYKFSVQRFEGWFSEEIVDCSAYQLGKFIQHSGLHTLIESPPRKTLPIYNVYLSLDNQPATVCMTSPPRKLLSFDQPLLHCDKLSDYGLLQLNYVYKYISTHTKMERKGFIYSVH